MCAHIEVCWKRSTGLYNWSEPVVESGPPSQHFNFKLFRSSSILTGSEEVAGGREYDAK